MRGGTITSTGLPVIGTATSDCDRDRLQLGQIDNERQFERMLDEANRANTSFYPIDPRGLVAFDTPIGPSPPPSIQTDQKMLQARTASLRTLAQATDGLAIVSTNNIAGGLRRVVDDLTSYYLLGYYATGRLDGRFHTITVRVKRPGVSVRARRGYLAATEVDGNAATAATASPSAAPSPAAAADARAISLALSPLEGYARPLPIRLHAAAGWRPGNAAAVWTVGELGPGPEWRGGADAELSLLNPAGATIATAQVRIEPGARAFRALFAPDQPLAPGDYVIRVRVKTPDAADSASETLRITLRDTPEATGGIFVRQGRSTITLDLATSDLRFRRTEQIRLEVPAPSDAAFAARLLDRTGKPLALPVGALVRDDADGSRWQVAQLTLAPLAPADYVIEIAATSGGERSLFAFRVVP